MEELTAPLEALPELERALVLEYYFEGRSHAETGRRHDLSGEAARKRISRALNQMRLHLEQRGTAMPWLALAAGLSLRNPAAAGTSAVVSGSLKTMLLTVTACTAVACPAWLHQERKITELQQQTAVANHKAGEARMVSGPPGEDLLWPVHRATDPALFPDILPLTQGFAASFSAWSQPGDFSGPLSLQITLTLTNFPAGPALPAPALVEVLPRVPASGNPP